MLFIIIYKILQNICSNYENKKKLGLISILFGLVLYALLYLVFLHFTSDYLGEFLPIKQLIIFLLYVIIVDYRYLGINNLDWHNDYADVVAYGIKGTEPKPKSDW